MWTQVLRINHVVAIALGVATLSCGGAPQREMSPVPPRLTQATLAGPLCDTDRCQCAAEPAAAGLPARAGHKRYEIRIGPIDNELWVRIGDDVLHKSVERATECFYVDLRPGKHPVTVRGRGDNGFAAQVHIGELGPGGRYDTFDLVCGGPDRCSLAALRDFQEGLARFRKNVHDPCGSTKIRDIDWFTGSAPDRVHPTDLQLELVLDVYNFPPRHPPGDPACADNY